MHTHTSSGISASWPLIFDLKQIFFQIGLGESYMHGDWCARPGIKAFLTALIRAKSKLAFDKYGMITEIDKKLDTR